MAGADAPVGKPGDERECVASGPGLLIVLAPAGNAVCDVITCIEVLMGILDVVMATEVVVVTCVEDVFTPTGIILIKIVTFFFPKACLIIKAERLLPLSISSLEFPSDL